MKKMYLRKVLLNLNHSYERAFLRTFENHVDYCIKFQDYYFNKSVLFPMFSVKDNFIFCFIFDIMSSLHRKIEK